MPRYIGGPCDGQTVHDIYYGFVYCRGAKYRSDESNNYVWIGLPTPAAPAPLAGTHSATVAWTKLMRALGKDLPRHLTRARVLAHHLKRVVR